jgi:hypothetical protein
VQFPHRQFVDLQLVKPRPLDHDAIMDHLRFRQPKFVRGPHPQNRHTQAFARCDRVRQKAGVQFLDRPGRREAARGVSGYSAAGEKRQGQNRLTGLIFYDHHQSRIVGVCIVALFSQLLDCGFGVRKCRRCIQQVCASRIIIHGLCLPLYRKEISRHGTPRFYGVPANMIGCARPLFPIRRMKSSAASAGQAAFGPGRREAAGKHLLAVAFR